MQAQEQTLVQQVIPPTLDALLVDLDSLTLDDALARAWATVPEGNMQRMQYANALAVSRENYDNYQHYHLSILLEVRIRKALIDANVQPRDQKFRILTIMHHPYFGCGYISQTDASFFRKLDAYLGFEHSNHQTLITQNQATAEAFLTQIQSDEIQSILNQEDIDLKHLRSIERKFSTLYYKYCHAIENPMWLQQVANPMLDLLSHKRLYSSGGYVCPALIETTLMILMEHWGTLDQTERDKTIRLLCQCIAANGKSFNLLEKLDDIKDELTE